jgi:hypothetical protein
MCIKKKKFSNELHDGNENKNNEVLIIYLSICQLRQPITGKNSEYTKNEK